MLNWDDEITAVTGAEARMLRASPETIQVLLDRLDMYKALLNPFMSRKDLQGRLVRLCELLSAHHEAQSRRVSDMRKLAVILRRWMSERRVRFLNAACMGGLPSLTHHVTRSAAANMRLVAPIGAPPQSV
ncbi:hypothetical protein [Paraburkholderia xenovorans]|jgi:hypothetical protein